MIHVVKFYNEIRGGSSLPLVVGGSDGNKYVVKLRGSGDGVVANVIEWVAIKLGRLAGIPVVEPVLLEIDAGFGIHAEDPEIQELLDKSSGVNFGSRFIEAPSLRDDGRAAVIDTALQQDIFLYDLFLLNIDRNWKNPNILFDRHGLWALDFSSSLTIRGIIDGRNYEKLAILREMKRHPFYTSEVDAYDFVSRLQRIENAHIQGIIEEIPNDWLAQLRFEKRAPDPRIALGRKLIEEKNNAHLLFKRIDTVRILKAETDEERESRMLKNWKAFEQKHGKM